MNALAYVDLRYHRSYALEIRELGDTGWAVHVYAPGNPQAYKLVVLSTAEPAGLAALLAEARQAVDQDLLAAGTRPAG
jgi:hypothetical protein